MSIWDVPEQVSEYKKYMSIDSLMKYREKTIVSFGDSITLANKCEKEKRWTYLLEKRLNRKVVNAGVGGTTSSLGFWRLDRDVISLNPSLVIFCFLLNDGHICGWETPETYFCKMSPEQSILNIVQIAKKCKEKRIHVILWTGSPIGSNYVSYRLDSCPMANEFNHIQRTRYEYFYNLTLDTARRENILFVDTYQEFSKTGDIEKYLDEDNIHHNEYAQTQICNLIYNKIIEMEIVCSKQLKKIN